MSPKIHNSKGYLQIMVGIGTGNINIAEEIRMFHEQDIVGRLCTITLLFYCILHMSNRVLKTVCLIFILKLYLLGI
jgi:hypothetical protein